MRVALFFTGAQSNAAMNWRVETECGEALRWGVSARDRNGAPPPPAATGANLEGASRGAQRARRSRRAGLHAASSGPALPGLGRRDAGRGGSWGQRVRVAHPVKRYRVVHLYTVNFMV